VAAIEVHELIFDFRGQSIAESVESLRRFAAEVIPLGAEAPERVRLLGDADRVRSTLSRYGKCPQRWRGLPLRDVLGPKRMNGFNRDIKAGAPPRRGCRPHNGFAPCPGCSYNRQAGLVCNANLASVAMPDQVFPNIARAGRHEDNPFSCKTDRLRRA
jgi:hypothetical protein